MLFVDTFIFLEVFLEAFPVSSSGHALLCSYLLAQLCGVNDVVDSYALINHIGHGPIACAVMFFFMRRYAKALPHVRLWFPVALKLCAFGFVCDLITGIAYNLYPHGSLFFLPYGFAITAVCLYGTRYARYGYRYLVSLPLYIRAILFGVVQSCALLPGISRLGITYACARWFGIRSERAFQLSFLLSLPVSIAGFAKGMYQAWSLDVLDKLLNQEMLLVMLGSGLLLVFNLNIMERIARNNGVWKFSWYLAVMSVLTWIVII